MAKENKIPLYTKIGAKITIILILILSFIILKNCVGAIIYGTATDTNEVNRFYKLGFTDGTGQAEGVPTKEPLIDNPLLKKAYRQGFREGWDSVRHEERHDTGLSVKRENLGK